MNAMNNTVHLAQYIVLGQWNNVMKQHKWMDLNIN